MFKKFCKDCKSIINHNAIYISIILISIFASIKLLRLFNVIQHVRYIGEIEFLIFLFFCIPFYYIIKNLVIKQKESLLIANYQKKLNEVLIEQSHEEAFYMGDLANSSKILINQVIETFNVDRASIWLYAKDHESIVCEYLYNKSPKEYEKGLRMHEKDFKTLISCVNAGPLIVLNNANSHPAVECFLNAHARSLNISSVLIVPIWYRGEIVGIISIESCDGKNWKKEEVDFAQLLSSHYSFAYSIKQNSSIYHNLTDMEKFIDKAALLSKTDHKGKIIYVNEKFTEVSGWSYEEIIGKDHRVLNSGFHDDNFWEDMYNVTKNKKKIWNSVVTNRAKDGSIYFVDTFIKADFDENGKLKGYTSIRQDVSDIITSLHEINKKNSYLEHAAKIIRHDMHSGINTYIPRGITSLERRLSPELIKQYKLEVPLKLLKEGLSHAQKVYKGVYEFTNLVKSDSELTKTKLNLSTILKSFLSSTAYKSYVKIDELPEAEINESLFCTAIDNLIRNGLKYNDSSSKVIHIYMEDNFLCIQDNGRGMTRDDLDKYSEPYIRKEGQKESGSGLGLNICIAILKEHGFDLTCEKNEIGTKIKIEIIK